MKKYLFLLVSLLIAIPASAQLNVKAKSSIKPIGSVRTGIINVFQADSLFYISLKTDNNYDDPGIFDLGKGKDAAFATLDDMVKILNDGEPGEAYQVDGGHGRTCTLVVAKQLGVRILKFSFPECAGSQSMSKGELEKVKDIIDKKGK